MNVQNPTLKKAMLLALEQTYGIVTKACNLVDINRSTHYDWLKTDEEYKQAVEDIDNVAIDHSESKLHELIDGVMMENKEDGIYKLPPNVTAIIFHLKTKGKKRGYNEREAPQQDDQETIQPPNVTFIMKDMSGTKSETI